MVELVDMLGLGSSFLQSKGSSPFFGIFQINMLALFLGYTFSVIFENSVIKLFKNNFYFKVLTLPGASVCWLYQEHVRRDYNVTGAKKFILEHTFRYNVLTQFLFVCKCFCEYTHLISILEFGTFFLLFSLYSVILINHCLSQFKIAKRICTNNYLNFFLLGVYYIKNAFIRILYLPLNDKIFYSTLFLLYKCNFLKIYFWVDFFFFFRLFSFIMSLFIVAFSIFLSNYLIYHFLISNYPKNIVLLIKIFIKKLIFYFFSLFSIIFLVLSDISIQNISNENFFKEIFFKTLFFLVLIS